MNITEFFDDDPQQVDNIPSDPTSQDPQDPQVDSDPVIDYLKQVGMIPEDLKYEKDEDLEQIVQKSKDHFYTKAAEELKNSVNPELKPLMEYALNGGSSLEEFIQAFSQPDFSKIDLDNEDNQKQVLKYYWKTTSNFSDEKIDKLVTRIQELGDLKSEALSTIEDLKTINEEKKQNLILRQQEQRQKEEEQRANRVKEFYQKFETYQTSSERKQKMKQLFSSSENNFQSLMDKVYGNYDHMLQLADLLIDYDPSKGFNLDRIAKKQETNKVENLRALLEKKADTKTPLSAQQNPNKEDDFLTAFLNTN